MKNTEKLNRIAELAEEAGWINLADREALMTQAGRSYNQGAVTDALSTLVDENRASKGLAPMAECTERVSYCDPRHEGVNVHAELRDGKIHSAAFSYFGTNKATNLTAIIRLMEEETIMAKYR